MKNNLSLRKISFWILICSLSIFKAKAQEPNSEEFNSNAGITKNRGQLLTSDRNVATEPLYYSNQDNISYYFLQNKIALAFNQTDDEKNTENDFRIDLRFLNSIQNPTIRENNQMYYKNFYLSHTGIDGVTNVGVFDNIQYDNLYDGIKLNCQMSSGLKMEFTLNANTALDQLKFNFSGIRTMSINDKKSLTITSDGGSVTYAKPIAYQIINSETRFVDAEYLIESNNISFNLASYDMSLPITIIVGPIKLPSGATTSQYWTTFIDGNYSGEHNGIWLDGSNQIYTTGKTSSTNYPVMVGQFTTSNGLQNAFVYKFNSQRGIVWGSYVGGTAINATGNKIVTNSNGFVYVGGDIIGTGLPTCSCTSDPILNNTTGADCFLFKFNSSGFVGPSITGTFATYFGGGNESLKSMTIDNNNNLYLGGFVQFTAFAQFPHVILSGAYNQSFIATNNVLEGFITKINSSNVVTWSTAFGGNNGSGIVGDNVGGMVTDASNNLYITGASSANYSSTILSPPLTTPDPGKFPLVGPSTGNPFIRGNSGLNDAYVVKFNTNGAILWSTLFGGQGQENINANSDYYSDIAITSQGNIVITGYTASSGYGTNYPLFPHKTTQSYQYDQTSYGGGDYDAFIAMFDPNYELIWSSYYGGSGTDMGKAIATAPQANVMYFTGFTSSSNFPTKLVAGSYQQTFKGTSDGYLLQFGSFGNRQYAMWYGGSDNCWAELGQDIATDFDGSNIIFCGKSCSLDFPFKDKSGISDYFYQPTFAPYPKPYSYVANLFNFCNPCQRLANQSSSDGSVDNLSISFHPNPVAEVIHLEPSDLILNTELVLYNSIGKQVKTYKNINSDIYVGDLASGFYILKSTNNQYIKFIKE